MGSKLVYNIIRSESGTVLAVADAELLNRRFTREDGAVLEVNEEFFGDKVGDENDVLRHFDEADMIVLVGKRSVELAARLGLVAPGSEIVVGGVPYVQIFKSLMLG
ncbi:hypothetical protein ASAC_1288 [Acidilobus saccharovorans 345-15]|uniref:DUF424 domain-containing protein n=1 Tax=Acidilobus saccharovorans (strain DSM 16705 / JCM 18335 / VKM B-2471 / 345-15) TaxID=666510 RepID=D9Q305_ACIS3|nr:DUF424 family protein [Acidilobus saccharovorans]ADL19693.1 hypothetical protein ASAC_1288 [Acidilobus saccharovorans 345-15]